MNSIDLSQIVETLSLGVLVLDPEARIVYWNRWLENASGHSFPEVRGRSIFELYPELENPAFMRNFRSVLSFGNYAYFSQRVHDHLLPLRPAPGATASGAEFMSQHCVMGPIREGPRVAYAYLTIEDVSETVIREKLLSELAMHDVLTSAYNRRYFDRRLAEELERSRRYGHSLSLVMLDLDHFKEVNDRYGHLFGDEALKHAARVWVKAVRVSDVVARYGGEEFCIIFPETGIDEACLLAERARAAIAAAPVEFGGLSARITASAGVAVSRPDDGSDDILHRADEALYRAKAAGRNRTECSA